MGKAGRPRKYLEFAHLSDVEYATAVRRKQKGQKPRSRKHPDLAHLSPKAYHRELNRRAARERRGLEPGEPRPPLPHGLVCGTPEYFRHHRYGITPAEYDALIQAQNGCCALCEAETKLHVDHCHDTKKVRGLLCQACNTAIGKLKHDPALLMKAAEYCK